MAGPSPGFLNVLAARLGRWPPSVDALLDQLTDPQVYATFLGLVKELLPDVEAQVVAAGYPNGQVEAFLEHFQARYFPLGIMVEFSENPMEELLANGIPVALDGIADYDLHQPESFHLGIRLMGALVDLSDSWHGEEGLRVVWLESCAGEVDQEDLVAVGPGYTRDRLHRLLRGTDYQAVALLADWLCGQTGTYYLDYNWEDSDGLLPEWDVEEVQELHRQYQRAEEVRSTVMALGDWLEENPRPRFAQMVAFIRQREREAHDEPAHP